MLYQNSKLELRAPKKGYQTLDEEIFFGRKFYLIKSSLTVSTQILVFFIKHLFKTLAKSDNFFKI